MPRYDFASGLRDGAPHRLPSCSVFRDGVLTVCDYAWVDTGLGQAEESQRLPNGTVRLLRRRGRFHVIFSSPPEPRGQPPTDEGVAVVC